MTKLLQDAPSMLAFVNESPAAVAACDRTRWIALFARYSIVEDPVGAQPHLSGVYDRREGRAGRAPLRRFFDTFIAPNTIEFHVVHDIVCHHAVVRDLDIEITMAPGVRVRVPMHLLYELVEEHDQLRILRLAAHWEFLPMVQQALGFGWASIKTMSALGWRMLRLQGVTGTFGFCRALRCIGEPGKATVAAFVQAYNTGNAPAIEQLFQQGEVRIAWPSPRVLTDMEAVFHDFQGAQLRVSKLLAAGYTVSASCEFDDGREQLHGVLLFAFTRDKLLDSVTAYWQAGAQAASSSPDSG